MRLSAPAALAAWALALTAATARRTSAPSPGSPSPFPLAPRFRPPAAPLFVTSPFLSVWSACDTLPSCNTTHWSGAASNMAGLAAVDALPPLAWMGGAEGMMGVAGAAAEQVGPPLVYATSTVYSFVLHGVVGLNVTFSTPLVAPQASTLFPLSPLPGGGDTDLFSLPVTYITWAAASLDGQAHALRVYFDADATLVTNNSYATTTEVSWLRVPAQTEQEDAEERRGRTARPASSSSSSSSASASASASTSASASASASSSAQSSPSAPTIIGGDAVRVGAASQWPLDPVVCGQSEPLTASQTIVWGWLYGVCSTCAQPSGGTYAGPTWASRAAFLAGGPASVLPPDDPAPPKQVGEGFPGIAFLWAASLPASSPSSPISEAAAPATGFVTLFMDEVLSHNFSFDAVTPMVMPPYWRRDASLFPFNDTSGVPSAALAQAHAQHGAALDACAQFDAQVASDVYAAAGGGAAGRAGATPQQEDGAVALATLASLVYRQVAGHHALAHWGGGPAAPLIPPVAWNVLKEVASGGDTSSVDVIFPSSTAFLALNPSLLADLLLPVMVASSAKPYTKDWVVHDLGKFPIANRNVGGQEDMPSEETGNLLLMAAAIGYLNGSDLEFFRPFYENPLGFPRWGRFLSSQMPFPPRQGTTDDFLGSTANGTSLVAKGCSGLGAWGYIQWVFGNATGANATWLEAGACGAALVEFGWTGAPSPSVGQGPGSSASGSGSASASASGSANATLPHFAWSYDLQSSPSSFFCLYNLYFVRLLRQSNLLPNQTAVLAQLQDFYALDGRPGSVGQRYGVPLINGSMGMKLDWNTFLATALYDDGGPGAGGVSNSTSPVPSAFSSSVFSAMLAGANATNLRAPMTDLFDADTAAYSGKYRGRPVMGAVWAPVALARVAALPTMPHEAAMGEQMEAGHAQFRRRMG